MVANEFERIMLETTLSIKDKVSETCERLTAVESQIKAMNEAKQAAKDDKQSNDNKKYNRMMAIIAAVGAFTGISEIWNLAHSAK